MWVQSIDPVLFEILGFEIRYYGLVYVIGFLLGLWFLMKNRERLDLNKEGVYDLMFWIMVGVLIGSRVFHVLFWDFSYYLDNPLKMLYFWEGGMAFHGGLVGALIAGWIYCKKKKINLWKVADILVFPAIFALALGRIANFFNNELVGRVTDVKWCVDFGDEKCRHPYQLYDALGRFVVSGMLLFFKNFKDGFVFWVMVLLVGVERFFVDFYREESLYFGLGVGQWMSLVMVVVSIAVLIKYCKKEI